MKSTNDARDLAQTTQSATVPTPDPSGTPAPLFSVVAIGASAGGLRALQALFAALPPATGMAFVVIVHLAPEYASSLAELLQTHTRMPVAQVTKRVTMTPNHVYVIPPAQELTVQGNTLRVAPFREPHGQRSPKTTAMGQRSFSPAPARMGRWAFRP